MAVATNGSRDEGQGGRNKDARTLFFYIATVNTPAMVLEMVGVGSQYALAATDANGQYLDGSQNYKLTIPKDVPAKDFWSLVVYDPQTRSMLQTDQPYPSKNNDATRHANECRWFYNCLVWTKSSSRKRSQLDPDCTRKRMVRLLTMYGPLKPWFDKTWRPVKFIRLIMIFKRFESSDSHSEK